MFIILTFKRCRGPGESAEICLETVLKELVSRPWSVYLQSLSPIQMQTRTSFQIVSDLCETFQMHQCSPTKRKANPLQLTNMQATTNQFLSFPKLCCLEISSFFLTLYKLNQASESTHAQLLFMLCSLIRLHVRVSYLVAIFILITSVFNYY